MFNLNFPLLENLENSRATLQKRLDGQKSHSSLKIPPNASSRISSIISKETSSKKSKKNASHAKMYLSMVGEIRNYLPH